MNNEIADDIEILVEFANKHFTEDLTVDVAANRVEQFLATYRDDHDN
jgi:hypothetical protein